MKEEGLELIKRIAEFEDGIDPKSLAGIAGWRYSDVGVYPATLTRLRIEGLIKDGDQSGNYRGYWLTEKARALLITGEPGNAESWKWESLDVPDDMFEDIVGHNAVKELLLACLKADKPVHILLYGPPALAKSLFLWDIERVAGNRSLWLLGSATSKSGLWDKVAEQRTDILLIDELERMDAADTAALLSMMEGGRLVRIKKGRELDIRHEVRVIAATNRISKLSPELLSRFAICRIKAYGREEFQHVVKGVLVRREGVNAETADEIARRLDGRSQDVRDAVRVARLAPGLGAWKAVEMLLQEGGGGIGDS